MAYVVIGTVVFITIIFYCINNRYEEKFKKACEDKNGIVLRGPGS